jgi:hypothetical protein
MVAIAGSYMSRRVLNSFCLWFTLSCLFVYVCYISMLAGSWSLIQLGRDSTRKTWAGPKSRSFRDLVDMMGGCGCLVLSFCEICVEWSCLQVFNTLSNLVAIRPGRCGLALTPGHLITYWIWHIDVNVFIFLSVTNASFYPFFLWWMFRIVA